MMHNRNWKLIYGSYAGLEKKAIELINKEMGALILRDPGRYTIHVLPLEQDGGGVHACVGQDAGVHRQNVRHGHEGGDTGHDLGFDGGSVLGKLKNTFQHKNSTFLWSFRCVATIVACFCPSGNTFLGQVV